MGGGGNSTAGAVGMQVSSDGIHAQLTFPDEADKGPSNWHNA